MRRLAAAAFAGLFAVSFAPAPVVAQTAPAESALLRRIAAQATDVEAYLELARLYNGQQRFDDAARVLQEAALLMQRQAGNQRQAQSSRTLIGGTSPAPTQTTVAPVRPSTQPLKIVDVKPVYPPVAQAAGVQGIVIIEITIGPQGDVTDAKVLRGTALLDQAALDAVRQWRYRPTLLNGAPVSVLSTVTVNFRLDGANRGGAATPDPYAPLESEMAGRAVRVGSEIAEPKKIRDVRPEYPAAAQASRVQGIVILEALIDEEGRVGQTRILRSIPLLDKAAIDAVSQWLYTPTLVNGVATPVIMTVTVNFTLK